MRRKKKDKRNLKRLHSFSFSTTKKYNHNHQEQLSERK
jgi:replication fork clamp-binding protein CrfC